ncbi:MAG TPA: alpha/beta hydrolase [Candidatus Limnocylindria bacterium]
MRITERGDPSRSPLVLLHGLASSPRCWQRTLPAVEQRHRVLMVDLFAGATRRFGLDDSARELAQRLVDLGIGPAALVGHSMGGLVALHVSAEAPELVASMVLVDVPAIPIRRRRLGQAVAVARSSVRRDASALGLVLGCVLRTSPITLIAATRATMRADLERQAAGTPFPTLLVWGGRDAIVPRVVGERLALGMPAAELVVIPDAGHQPMWEAPAAFNAALVAFLATVVAPAGHAAAVSAGDRAAPAPPHRPPGG